MPVRSPHSSQIASVTERSASCVFQSREPSLWTAILSSRCRAVSSVSNVDIGRWVATLDTSLDWMSLSCRVDGWFGWRFYVLAMRAQRLISPSTGRVSWTVVGRI